MVTKKTGALFICCALISCAFGQGNWLDSLQPRLVFSDSKRIYSLSEAMNKHSVNSVSIATVEDNRITLVQTFRYTGGLLEERDKNTKFQAASISKSLTALGVLLMAEEHEIDLSSSVNSLLKSWKIPSKNDLNSDKISIRALLSHTAGLNVHGFPGYKSMKQVPGLIELLNGEGNTDAVEMIMPADSVWQYSGGGYEVLQLLIEDLTQRDFAGFMKEKVLIPLGMKNSTFHMLTQEDCPECAHAYNRDAKPFNSTWNQYPESAAAGLWTTAEDLAIFLTHLGGIYDGQEGIISKKQLEELINPVENGYALGLSSEVRNDEHYIGHSGKNLGFSNNMQFNLDRKDGIIVLTDSDGAFPLILDIERTLTDQNRWVNDPQIMIKPIKLTVSDLKKFTGNYAFVQPNDEPYEAKVYVKKGKLFCRDKERSRTFELVPVSNNRFVDSQDGISVEFKSDSEGMFFSWDERIKFIRK